MEFLHTMIRVKDIEKSLKFYTELLDMKLARQKQLEDYDLYFLTDKNETVQLELTYNKQAPEGGYELGTGFGHLAFRVKSMDEFTEKLHGLNYEYSKEPYKLSSSGSTISFINDPDGYEIELIEK